MAGRYFALLDDERGVIEITGPDRREFLQGLITNDTAKLSAGRALYAALLTPQGRYLHDFFLVEMPEAFLLDAERARLDDLLRRLTLYKLRSRVDLKIAREMFHVVVAFGEDALQCLGLPPDVGAARSFESGIAYVDPRLTNLGARIILPREIPVACLQNLQFVSAQSDAYDNLRLSLGIPDGSRDLPIAKALLLEAGFDELNGIDWNKGCYVGQELTARTRYRALIKKRLMPVQVTGPMPPPGSPIMLGEEDVGEVRSGRDGVALALLRLDALREASRNNPLRAGEARLAPSKPAWANFQI
jgi:folate-binding protein YgfZ